MMNRLLKALLTSLWFVVLCAPIMGTRKMSIRMASRPRMAVDS